MSRKARAVPVFMPLLYHSSGLRQEVRITVQVRERSLSASQNTAECKCRREILGRREDFCSRYLCGKGLLGIDEHSAVTNGEHGQIRSAVRIAHALHQHG